MTKTGNMPIIKPRARSLRDVCQMYPANKKLKKLWGVRQMHLSKKSWRYFGSLRLPLLFGGINEEKYIEWQNEHKIPKSQYSIIETNYDKIIAEFKVYLNGYVKAARKGRAMKEPLYRVSSLHNFNNELGIMGWFLIFDN